MYDSFAVSGENRKIAKLQRFSMCDCIYFALNTSMVGHSDYPFMSIYYSSPPFLSPSHPSSVTVTCFFERLRLLRSLNLASNSILVFCEMRSSVDLSYSFILGVRSLYPISRDSEWNLDSYSDIITGAGIILSSNNMSVSRLSVSLNTPQGLYCRHFKGIGTKLSASGRDS